MEFFESHLKKWSECSYEYLVEAIIIEFESPISLLQSMGKKYTHNEQLYNADFGQLEWLGIGQD